MHWSVQDAKARFSEVIERARTEGPQTVTRHGRKVAVVVSAEEDDRAAEIARNRAFVAQLLAMPEGGDDDLFDPLPRAPMRDLDL